MKDTHTPMEIEGKIYVVVDAPNAEAILNTDYSGTMKLLAACTKYETLEQDAPYWIERIGQRVEVEFDYTVSHRITYAIPPQQKQGDEWDEANKEAEDYASRHASIQRTPMLWIEMYQTCLRNNYQLIKRK